LFVWFRFYSCIWKLIVGHFSQQFRVVFDFKLYYGSDINPYGAYILEKGYDRIGEIGVIKTVYM